MARQPVIYHNPRCTKSRLTLELLKDRGYAPQVVEYLDAGLKEKEIDTILTLLAMEPRDFMRKGEAAYKESGADNPGLSRKELIAKIAEHPILFERPVVVCGGRAAIGRPPENVVVILEEDE